MRGVLYSRTVRTRGRDYRWASWPDERLLDLRLCDLGVKFQGTWLVERTERLLEDLEERDLRIRPSFWISDEWCSPDGVVGIAIPFFLTHPRLRRLERKQMFEVEGGTPASSLRLLRHEAGHALQHAFHLHRRRRWQRVFGKSSTPYPKSYRPNPGSRRVVVHLDYWYGQSHPDEDFAETFAVWLTPGSRWRRRYEGSRALKKLEYVDGLMDELAGRQPVIRKRVRVDEISRLRSTLREYYAAKRRRFKSLTTNIYDGDLLRLFRGPHARGGEPASTFLRRNRTEIRRLVAKGTGSHQLALDTVLSEMIARCRELKLRAIGARRTLLLDFAILLAARSVEYVYGEREWHPL